jgi:hypothetical protein
LETLMKHYLSPIAYFSCLALLTGCLGGKSSDSSSSTSSGYAQFIDAPVEGVLVKRLSSGAEVTTDSEGRFDCEPNEILSFNVGGLELGQAACNSQVFVTDFGDGRWQRAAKILQCLSSTEPSSGKLKVSHVNADLSEIKLDSDSDTEINIKLGDHKRRTVHQNEAEGHAMGHLLDRVQYDPAFMNLFSGDTTTRSKSVTARKVETEGTGTNACPDFYNITFNFIKNTKTIDLISKVFYSAQLSTVAAYDADEALPGDDCSEIGPSGTNCRNWTDPEMKERPTIHRDEFKIVRFKNITTPTENITSGVKRLKIKGEFEVLNGQLVLEGDWKEEFNLNLTGGSSVQGECKYEFE